MAMEERTIAVMNQYPPNKYNLLIPVVTMQEISPLHKIIFNLVQLSSAESDGDAYLQKEKAGEVPKFSLTKTAILKLMTAANAVEEESKKILPTGCHRCTEIAMATKASPQCGNCKGKTDTAYQVSILVPDPAGGYRRYVGSKEMTKDTYNGKAEHMAAQCETKAMLRAVRAGLGIKGTYTAAELAKPFVVSLVVPNLDDPELKKAALDRYSSSVASLFSSTSPQALSAPSQTVTDTLQITDDNGNDGRTYNVEVVGGPSHDDEEPPWAEDNSSELAQEPACTNCGCVIDQNGSWTPERIKEYSERTYGRCLCPDCQKSAKKAGGR